MAKRKKKDSFVDAGLGLTLAGVTVGVGANIVQKAGGNAAGLSAVASYFNPAGHAIGGGILIGQLRKINKKTKEVKRK